MTTTSVVIVDDQDLVRNGLRLILAAEPDLDVVGEASDGQAGGNWSAYWIPTSS
jgi:DNA-binding NarL/FixJ family response regulator